MINFLSKLQKQNFPGMRLLNSTFFPCMQHAMASSGSSNNNDDMMKQAQHIWGMLDELADSDPEAYKKFIDKNTKESKEVMTPAKPYMCVCTRILVSWSSLQKESIDPCPDRTILNPALVNQSGWWHPYNTLIKEVIGICKNMLKIVPANMLPLNIRLNFLTTLEETTSKFLS